MGMWGGLVFEGIAEHIVEEAHQATERLGGSVEHMFGTLRRGSDGTGVTQAILQGSGEKGRYAGL
jgi:hypothetical protein